jgi:hypothetical protein
MHVNYLVTQAKLIKAKLFVMVLEDILAIALSS